MTADIINSTKYETAERRRINQILIKAFAEAARTYPDALKTQPAFRVTAGDEFQCVFGAVSESFNFVTYLRCICATSGLETPLTFRASMGVGSISVTGKTSSYEQDGEAFVRSRRGLEQLQEEKRTRWTKIITGDKDTDNAIDVVLLLLDQMQRDWTIAQWEAVKWILTGKTREQVSRKLKVAHQNVSKRLAAADWQSFKIASDFLKERLPESCKP